MFIIQKLLNFIKNILNFNSHPSSPQITTELLLKLLAASQNTVRPPSRDHPSIEDISKLLRPGLTLPSAITINTPSQIKVRPHDKDCGCNRKGSKSIADFMVNVPCPKPTEKPPRKVVVKLPCPATEKPYDCQCCRSKPCKKRKPKKESSSSESKESIELKTITPKRHNQVRPQAHYSESSEEIKFHKISPRMPQRKVVTYHSNSSE